MSLFLSDAQAEERSREGLIGYYNFRFMKGQRVRDDSGHVFPVYIEDFKTVTRVKGALLIHEPNRLSNGTSELNNHGPYAARIKKSQALTLEVWMQPANTSQKGPARIITLSGGTSHRNFTLGQDGDRIDVRLRTTKTSDNGLPSLQSPKNSVSDRLMHVVYTRNKQGQAKIYIDGKVVAQKTIAGDMGNWNMGYSFHLANEVSGDRPWLGTLYTIAVYDRALPEQEIQKYFKLGAGPGVKAAQPIIAKRKAVKKTQVANKKPARKNNKKLGLSKAERARLLALKVKEEKEKFFKSKVAPLLATRCLDCHGWKSTKAHLDMTRLSTMLKGGKEGPAIVPGRSHYSLIYESVMEDDMPEDGPPLNKQEKDILRKWIDDGAIWVGGPLSPSAYGRGEMTGAYWVPRLTVDEYIATVKDVLNVDIESDARKLLPADLRADGFSNTVYNLTVDLKHVESFAKLAQLIVSRMDMKSFAGKMSGSHSFDDKSVTDFITKLAPRLLREPLSDAGKSRYLAIAKMVKQEKGDFAEAAGFILEAMLQSPRFLYRLEKQKPEQKQPQAFRVASSYEMATRLSYILWGGPPDEVLLAAAEKDELKTDDQIAGQIKRMLLNPKAKVKATRFVDEWLHLARMDYLNPDKNHFPKWQKKLAQDMKQETRLFFQEVAWEKKRPLAELFNSQTTFMTPALAQHYGLKAKADSRANVSQYDLSDIPSRGGLLTHGSILTMGGDEASMVTRGLFVLHDVLRGKVKDPPPCVDTTPVATKAGLSMRGIAEERIKDTNCGGCHAKFEPLAFGLEKFDGLGTYFEVDKYKNKMREDGSIRFPEGSPGGESKKLLTYETIPELMAILARSERVKETLVYKMTQFAIGRPLSEKDKSAMSRIFEKSRQSFAGYEGGTYASIMHAVLTSDLVRKIKVDSKDKSKGKGARS